MSITLFTLLAILYINQSFCAGLSKFAWGYEGKISPNNWGKTFPMCNGKTQSGIDVITERTIKDSNICRGMTPEDWTMVNNKHSDYRVKYYGSSVSFAPVSYNRPTNKWTFQNLRDNSIVKLNNQFGKYTHIHKKFCLQSFHLHWGKLDEGGSEHNVDGLRYPLEAHFVHYSCDYPDIKKALTDKDPKDEYVLAVVGILFKLGNRLNPGFEDILTAKRNYEFNNSTNEFILKNIQIKHLLPELTNHLEFYAYEGSLTTPPCNPIVRWHLLKQVVTISPEQLERFKKMSSSTNINIAQNYRPVQKNRNDVFDCSTPLSTQIVTRKPNKDIKIVNNNNDKDNNKQKTDENSAPNKLFTHSLIIVTLLFFIMF